MEKGLRKIIEKARKDKDVLAVIVFGSYVRKKVRPKDIDVCLMLRPKKFSNLLMSNKKIEYLSLVSDKYDIQIFQQLPVFVRVRILKEGKFLLSKDSRTSRIFEKVERNYSKNLGF